MLKKHKYQSTNKKKKNIFLNVLKSVFLYIYILICTFTLK